MEGVPNLEQTNNTFDTKVKNQGHIKGLQKKLILTALTKGSNASATRYVKVVPVSTMVPRLSDVAKTVGSIGNICPLTAILCKSRL